MWGENACQLYQGVKGFILLVLYVESGRVDSGGSDRRRSANRSAGRTKPFIPDNDDSFSFSGSKEVGELVDNYSLGQVFNATVFKYKFSLVGSFGDTPSICMTKKHITFFSHYFEARHTL